MLDIIEIDDAEIAGNAENASGKFQAKETTEVVAFGVSEEAAIALAELDANKIDDGRILVMLQCEIADLNAIRQDGTYKQKLADLLYEVAQFESKADRSWRNVEESALQNISSGLANDPMNVELALKAAMLANRNRKADKKMEVVPVNTQNNTVNNTVVVMQLTPRIAATMQNMREKTAAMPNKITGMITANDLYGRLGLGEGKEEVEDNFTVDNLSMV